MNYQSLLESSKQAASRYEETKHLVEKWEKTGLLKGKDLKSDFDKHGMAQILENQAKQLYMESVQTNVGGGTFITGQGEQWAGVALPLVRKVFADISAKEFISVQPMNLPSGLIFYLEFKYGSNQPTTGNTRFNQGDSLYGTTNQKDVAPFGGLYGSGRFGYTMNDYTASLNVIATTASYADVHFNANYSASAVANTLRKISIQTASVSVPSLDKKSVRGFIITGSGVSESTIFAEFTSYDAITDTLSFIATGSAAISGAATVYYTLQPVDNNRGDFEDRPGRNLTGSNALPQLDFDFNNKSIVAKTRKVMGKWTPESAQDIKAYQSIDVEAEITSMMSEYISMEIDLELLDMVMGAVNTTDVWSAQSNRFYDKSTGTFRDSAAGAGGYYNSQGEWFQTLGTVIQRTSRKIHQKTLRGQANVIYTSPAVASIIESIPGYASDTSGDKNDFALGTQKIGSLNSRWKIIVNPYFKENTLFMAYKGSAFLECGAVYAPYVPLIMTPTVYDPETFTPRKGAFTRYAKEIIRPEFFAAIYVADLDKY
jgi:hypothetical protein